MQNEKVRGVQGDKVRGIQGDKVRGMNRGELIWLLSRKEGQWKTQGPFYVSELAEFLKKGLCSDRDFVWTPGLKEWQKISIMKGFSTHPQRAVEDILTHQSRCYKQLKPQKLKSAHSNFQFLSSLKL